MRVHLKGVHTVRKTLATGAIATYYYAWRGGPRLNGEPGTGEFIASFNSALAALKTPRQGLMATLIADYRASSEFTGRSPATRRDYARYLGKIEQAFGTMPIDALSDPRVRGDFKKWRDTMAATPRTADLAWSVLARVLSVAKDKGAISINPCERGGRLYAADRKDALWTEPMVATALAGFPTALRWALLLALWTGQRQGDLLVLPWSAYDGSTIRLRQSKTGARVRIPAGEPLRRELDSIPRHGPVILTSSDQVPWTSSGFRASWRRACATAGIVGVTFHDLRGSAATRLAEAGCEVPEIAAITGHSLADVSQILDGAYLSRTFALAENAIRKLEKRTESVNRE